MAVTCGDCGAPMKLKDSRYGKFFGCIRYPACRGTHGAHPDGKPLGVPADKTTREARTRAHAAFDSLWKGETPRMTRSNAYRWMVAALGLTNEEAHVSKFTTERCELLIKAVADDWS